MALTTREQFLAFFHQEKGEDLINVIFDNQDDIAALGGGGGSSTATSTGVLTGGEVTINADPTKFDVAAGTGQIVDWTDPANPLKTRVTWTAFTAETVPVLAAQFTSISIDINGLLVKVSGSVPTEASLKLAIFLPTVLHTNGTTITDIARSGFPAYNVAPELLTYVRALGPVNNGNKISANGTNLAMNRSAGDLTLPFINFSNDINNPSKIVTTEDLGYTFNYIYQNGAGGFTLDVDKSFADPNQFDDGSGTLATVSNNKWTFQLAYVFGQTSTPLVVMVYGQEEFNFLDDAILAAQTPDTIEFPILRGAVLRAAVIMKQGTTDLSNETDNSFLNYRK